MLPPRLPELRDCCRLVDTDLLEISSGRRRISTMTRKSYPLEFTPDAVALARENDAHLAQVAKGLGVARTNLLNSVRKAEKGDSPWPGSSQADMPELEELCRPDKLLEQEAEVMRRAVGYLSGDQPNESTGLGAVPFIRCSPC